METLGSSEGRIASSSEDTQSENAVSLVEVSAGCGPDRGTERSAARHASPSPLAHVPASEDGSQNGVIFALRCMLVALMGGPADFSVAAVRRDASSAEPALQKLIQGEGSAADDPHRLLRWLLWRKWTLTALLPLQVILICVNARALSVRLPAVQPPANTTFVVVRPAASQPSSLLCSDCLFNSSSSVVVALDRHGEVLSELPELTARCSTQLCSTSYQHVYKVFQFCLNEGAGARAFDLAPLFANLVFSLWSCGAYAWSARHAYRWRSSRRVLLWGWLLPIVFMWAYYLCPIFAMRQPKIMACFARPFLSALSLGVAQAATATEPSLRVHYQAAPAHAFAKLTSSMYELPELVEAFRVFSDDDDADDDDADANSHHTEGEAGLCSSLRFSASSSAGGAACALNQTGCEEAGAGEGEEAAVGELLEFFLQLLWELVCSNGLYVSQVVGSTWEMVMRLRFGLQAVNNLAPKVIAMLPGLGAGAAVCKQLLPESSLMGGLLRLLPVLLVPAKALLFLMLLQVSGDAFIIAGILGLSLALALPALIGAPLLKATRSKRDFLGTARTTRLGATLGNFFLLTCLLLAFARLPPMAREQLFGFVGWESAATLLLDAVVSVSAARLIASDALLNLLANVRQAETVDARAREAKGGLDAACDLLLECRALGASSPPHPHTPASAHQPAGAASERDVELEERGT